MLTSHRRPHFLRQFPIIPFQAEYCRLHPLWRHLQQAATPWQGKALLAGATGVEEQLAGQRARARRMAMAEDYDARVALKFSPTRPHGCCPSRSSAMISCANSLHFSQRAWLRRQYRPNKRGKHRHRDKKINHRPARRDRQAGRLGLIRARFVRQHSTASALRAPHGAPL